MIVAKRPSRSSITHTTSALAMDALSDVAQTLRIVRNCLDMDVAFISEFIGDTRVFRFVDSKLDHAPIRIGDVLPLTDGYCGKVVDGSLPGIIPDAALDPLCQPIKATQDLRIGSHLGVALRLPDGRLYGTLCCFKHAPDTSLNERDLRLLHLFGTMISRSIDSDLRQAQEQGGMLVRIQGVMRRGEPNSVYQPVFRLRDGLLLGAEALARFPGPPTRPPDLWFREAATVGMQVELELQAIRNAIAGYQDIWRQGAALRLAVNVSPETIRSPALQDALRRAPPQHMVLEITEHDRVDDYARLGIALTPLRQRGFRIAIDDAGAGYASLRHILQIEPDLIKIDISLTRGIDTSVGKRALAGGLIEFARQTNCTITAEGVETAAELATLRALRVDNAQGYLLGRPAPLDALLHRLATGGHADAPILPMGAP